MQILGRHASINLAHLTAARAAEAMRRSMAPAAEAAPARPERPEKEDGTSARRYARLLVSEIKLYNEAAVRLGRQKRDLLERLKPEIERARKRHSAYLAGSRCACGAVSTGAVQTLADGDASLLGNPATTRTFRILAFAGILVAGLAAAAQAQPLAPPSIRPSEE